MDEGGGDVAANLDLSLGGGATGAGSAAGLSRGSGAPGDIDYAARHLGPGSVLAGRYEVRAMLGHGGMGAVYLVLDRVRGAEVALKVMLPSLLARPRAVERFKHEAEVSLALTHEHIVRVFDVNEDPALGLRFYTMEHLQGVPLRAWIEEKRTMKSEITVDEALTIVEQILDALRYAHRTTVHRDLKPENVFILFGTEIHVKILDFGLAKLQSGTGFTATSVGLGTAYYMAPEQQANAAGVDPRADLYSVAVMLYELLTGRLPIGRFRLPSEERPGLPAGIDELIAKGLEADPARRIASADEFLAAVRALRAGASRKASGQGAALRRGGTASGVVSLLLLLAIGAGVAVGHQTGAIPPVPSWLNPFARPLPPSGPATIVALSDGREGAGTTGGGEGSTAGGSMTTGGSTTSGTTTGGGALTTGGTTTDGGAATTGGGATNGDGTTTAGATTAGTTTGGITGGTVETSTTTGGGAGTTTGGGDATPTSGTTGGTSETPPASPPTLTVTAPADGEVTRDGLVSVRGEARGLGVESVRINGQEVPVEADGRFRGRVELGADGPHRIEVVVRDAERREVRRELTVARDLVPPAIEIVSPVPGTRRRTNEAELRVEGLVREANLRRLETHEGTPIPVGPTGRFVLPWKLAREGLNQVTLIATDAAGQSRSATVEAWRDTVAPDVELAAVPARIEVGTTITVAGTVSEDCFDVRVANQSVPVVDGRFSRPLRLGLGAQAVEVVAIDTAGNATRRRIDVTVVPRSEAAPPDGNGTKPPATEPILPGLPLAVPGIEPGKRPGEFISKKDEAVMVFIPPGAFPMGAEDGAPDEAPVHTVELRGFYIDRTEVTVGQFAKFVEETRYVTDAERDGVAYTLQPGRGFVLARGASWRSPGYEQTLDFPVVCVSWRDAAEYAKWAGKRLPTEAEWERAASWDAEAKRKRTYAWGDDYPPAGRAANIADRRAARELKLPRGSFAPEHDDGFAHAAPVGSFPDGRAPSGALDMSGNVWEWCLDWYGERFYASDAARANPTGPPSGTERVYRGGSWFSPIGLRTTTRVAADPTVRYANLGFRCVKSE